MKYPATTLQQFGESLLVAAGLATARARDVAEVLLEGDLLGHTTHGFALLPAYLDSLKQNGMARDGDIGSQSGYMAVRDLRIWAGWPRPRGSRRGG